MLAKITSKNQITIPKKVFDQLPRSEYYDVQVRDGAVVLRPVSVRPDSLEGIQAKMRRLGLGEDCVAEAVAWARSK